jgi:D-lactate dehydrogenase (cytochrome)
VGHVGDGNFHLAILIDPNKPTELAQAEGLNEKLIARALEMGGTCTGEHGIGIGKIKHLKNEHGSALDAMCAIKKALDPHGLMNPGKVLHIDS